MNKKNRLAVWLCLVLTVLMVVSAIPAGAISVSVAGVTTPEQTVNTPNGAGEIDVNTGNPALDDSVPVGNPGEGYTPVGTAINSAEDFNNMKADGKYYLAADITIEKTYTGFEGVFDGNGHTVTTTVPVFHAPQGATIKNLVVTGSVYTVENKNTAAVASGTSVDCNFFNILNQANVIDVEGAEKGDDVFGRVSGIAGRTAGYTIFERCTNEGNLQGYGISAGITALVSGDDGSYAVFVNCVNKGSVTISTSSAAGIACGVEGPSGTTLFYNCRNEGAITSPGSAGGIVGYANDNSLNTVNMRLYNCTNSGAITSLSNDAGGMIGVSNIQTTIENCTNEESGKVIAGVAPDTSNQRKAGGIIGRANAAILISGCVNHADIDGAGQSGGIGGWLYTTQITIQNCKNFGDVTSRLNYAGGIVARADNANDFTKEMSVVISDCVNEGNVTIYNGNVGGIVSYSQSPVTVIRCTNKGNVGARSDVPDKNSATAGGIVGAFSSYVTVIDCRNDGNVTGKASYTVAEDGTVTAQSGGTAGGIIGSSGDATYLGVTRVTGCVNTGAVKSGESKMATVANNTMYAGGIVGYQYGGGSATYLMVSYCINTGDVTAASDASYVLGYGNLSNAVITCNVLAGKLTSTCFPTGVNAKGSSVLNALFWNNAATLPETCYSNNWVVDTFEGTMLNNKASTDAGSPVGMDGYISYRFSETDDPFEIMDLFVKEDSPRDVATPITSADEFLAMSPIGNYKLENDITLTTWWEGTFLGTFDGDGHTITVNGLPAFDGCAAGATIKNLTVKGTVSYEETTGGVVRWGGATYINVHNEATVTATKNNAGGIVGSTSSQPAVFENCTNSGTITSTTGSAGGIVGYMPTSFGTRLINCVNNGEIKAPNGDAAGIAGYTTSRFARFVGCVNNGTISGSTRVGGIVGESQTGDSKNAATVYVADAMYENCVNTGKITSTSASGTFAGGIEGYNGTSHVTLKNCFNSGDITGPSAAGIFGDARKGFIATGAVNTGNITATKDSAGGIYNHGADSGCQTISLTGAINTGAVKGVQAGGIAGQSNQIAGGKNHVLKSCITLGDVVGTGVNVGGLVGYMYAGGNILPDVQNCIVAGTVTTTGDRAGALIGYSNTNKATIKNNVIVAPVSAKVATHVFMATGAQALSATTDDETTTYTIIAQNNMVKPGIAMYDTQTGHGAVTIPLGKCSSGTVEMNDFVMDSTVNGAMLMIAGINPGADGKFSSAFDSLLPEANRTGNKVAIINAAGETVATVSSLVEACASLTEGATLKLMADYYAATPENLYANGISFTLDGNGYNFYSANAGKYMLTFNGNGAIAATGLTIYAQGAAVKVGVNRKSAPLTVTLNNMKIYAGGANENGYSRYSTGKAMYVSSLYANVTVEGDGTVFKNANEILIQGDAAALNLNAGNYVTRYSALETWNADAVVNINGGTFVGASNFDALVTAGSGTINITGGYLTNNGMCVARTLGGKTKTETNIVNEVITETNATLNIFGGTLVAASGTSDGWHHAVVRCGGGSTYGMVNIMGGTFVNQKTASEQVIFKNNTCASLSIFGGKFLASEAQKNFMKTNGCADVTTDSGYQPTDSHTSRAVSAYSGTYTYEGASYKIWTIYGATDSKYAMTTESGAQVRMTAGSTGLRFISTITAEKVAAAKALAGTTGTVSYGTVIAPVDYVLRADAFTMAALDEALTNVSAGKRYVDIEAKDGLTEDEDGNVEIRAALTNIKEGNLTRAFAAVSYVKVVDADGNATYYYSEFDAVENVRAIRQVAEAALADTNETQEGAYIYAILDDEGNVVAYSRYSDSERAVLKTFTA